MKNSQFQSSVSMEFDKYCHVLKPLIWTVTSAAYDDQFSKTSFGATTFIHSWSVHFALTEIQLQSISTKIIIICKDYQPSPESNTKNITIMKKIIIMFSMMGLASGRTTLFVQNVIMVTSSQLQKFRIQYLFGLDSRSSIPLQKTKQTWTYGMQ